MPSKENMTIKNKKPEIRLRFIGDEKGQRHNQREPLGMEHSDAHDSMVDSMLFPKITSNPKRTKPIELGFAKSQTRTRGKKSTSCVRAGRWTRIRLR